MILLVWLIPITFVTVPEIKAQTVTAGILNKLTPVRGEISPPIEEAWEFNGMEGEVISFRVESISGDFDPRIRLTNNSRTISISNDDYMANSRNALLEAITLPRTDTYRLSVSGFGETSGSYQLTLLPGYSNLGLEDSFDGDLSWDDLERSSNPLELTQIDGQLRLALGGSSDVGVAFDVEQLLSADFFAQVDVQIAGGSDGWIVGMTARQQDVDNYYLFSVNQQGQWRFLIREDGNDRLIRDWTPHPAIIVGGLTFKLGMMVNGGGFDFFYNDRLIGRIDDFSIHEAGHIGLAVVTGGAINSQSAAHFDNLVVTAPELIDGERLVPQQILIGTPNAIARDLQRQALIPAGGSMSLNVGESFIESQRPGVERILLGRGTLYEHFAYGSTVSWEVLSAGLTGCGLVFQAMDEMHYRVAYVDQSGAYGLSERIGDSFMPGVFGEKHDLVGNRHHLLVIVQEQRQLYYLDGFLVGTLATEAIEGSVGNAVVNFEPIRTSCSFTDSWVWNWSN